MNVKLLDKSQVSVIVVNVSDLDFASLDTEDASPEDMIVVFRIAFHLSYKSQYCYV
jgi:hypothetical protein